MKTLCRVLAAILVLGAAGPAAAGSVEWYLLGGPVRANLGHDGLRFGDDMQTGLQTFLGGDWTVKRMAQPALDVGLGLETRPGSRLGLAVELHYVRHGSRWQFTDHDTLTRYPGVTERFRLNTVELPVLVQVRPRPGSWIEPLLVAGPTIAFSLRSSLDVKAAGQDHPTDLEMVVPDVHVGGLLGAGLRLRTSPAHALLLQGRFAFDLNDRFRDFDYDLRSRDVSLLVGYTFGGRSAEVQP